MAVLLGVRQLGRLSAGLIGVLGVHTALTPVQGWRRAGLHGISLLSSADIRRYSSSSKGNLSYIQGPKDIELVCKTVGECFDDTVKKFPDREALVAVPQNIRKTFAQLKQEVDMAALGLVKIGINTGDRLAMWSPNSYEWVLMQLATAQAGIVLVSVNPAYQAQELEFVLKKVNCKAIVFPNKFKTQNYYNILKLICPELETCSPRELRSERLPDLTTVIMVDSKLPGTLHMNDVLQSGNAAQMDQLRDIEKSLSCYDPINIQFTSGTTGTPKAATLSHHNIVNNSIFIGRRMNLHKKEARLVLPSPLYHCLGSVGGTMVSILYGVTFILSSPSFEGKTALEVVARERATLIYGTPTMYIDMLNQPDFSSYDLSSLQGGVIAGSLAPPELIRAIIRKMNMVDLTVAYGTTENSPVTFMQHTKDSIERKTQTVGRIMDHTEAKILDLQTGKELERNMAGELCIRGYCVMLGYWDDPQKTEEAIDEDKWYWTGDVATIDEEGFCRIVGRSKDMIIRGGENIYPAELEDFFHKHPMIQEVQVIGVKDHRLGEEICACIRLKGTAKDITPEDLKAYCKGKISHFKIPRYIVFVKDYPLTASGKIQKYKLRQRMEEHLKL
ncbi:medium-chain acyl-CoA ligase ACSF2, mitochondrial isoform X1 [Monodelphis domestica]|uniref:medium-chain acyl-CoA ligase ACSF2, mitochondrial isoform X1 n=2 Tax=Monodelphis domestica TaxID=13616 RepID=UPI0024E1D9B7|nr:medium-chain acyl-CoA ligase ACSF2, mitochondrial isoform X1 [Monodelphis domestica]